MGQAFNCHKWPRSRLERTRAPERRFIKYMLNLLTVQGSRLVSEPRLVRQQVVSDARFAQSLE